MTGDGTKRIDACLKYFSPPCRLNKAAFTNYKPKTKEQAEALEICKKYSIADIEQGRGLFLFGTWGTGKTHLGIATVRNLIELNPELFGARENELDIYDPDRLNYYGLYCSFFSTVDLLDALRPGSEAKQQKAEQLFHRAKTDHLIVLDDIGAEKPTVWVEDRLFTLVDLRYRTERATIFTSNCTEEELNNRLGGRLVSRIFEMAEPVQVTGPDHRRS